MPDPELEINRSYEAAKLVEDFDLINDAEFFTNPENRIGLLTELTPEDFYDLTKHINDRIRGYEPKDRAYLKDKGSFLPLLATPNSKEKPEAFSEGYSTILDYLRESKDSAAQKVKGAGMAVEALIIWVHPFNDGNGQTSRFLGKFIEDGTTDIGELIGHTVDKNNRLRMYEDHLRIDQANMSKGMEKILTNKILEANNKTVMPVVKGISLSIKRLLEDKTFQDKVEADQARLQAKYKRAQEIFGKE
jgi:hypothetical protein